ncbi:MAG: GldG family protein, partial [Pseudomonadota bacterium]
MAEQEAIAEGMTPIPARVAGEPAFMGLVGTNEIDGKEFIPLFQGGPDAERFREYEIARAIASLSRVDKPVVGLMSPLPIAGTPANPVSGQGERPRWEILTRIIDSFRVLLVPTVGTQEIDPQVDVLLVIHPRDLDDQALYRLEQFILGGGRAVILTDTYYLRGAAQARASQVTSVLNRDFDSTLGPVFDAWGLVFDTDETASDEARAAVLPQSSERGTIEVPHVHI